MSSARRSNTHNQWFFVLIRLALVIFLSTAVLMPPHRVHAQGLELEPGETLQQPKTRTTQVTAGVHDRDAPSTPILIAPANESLVVTSTPTFIWRESTDNFAIEKYELILDGITFFTPIPLTDAVTSNFTLTFSQTTREYTLVPKSGLTEGLHSWKIVAYDIHNNQTSSVTWTFTIDTRAPVFIVTNIDTQVVTISAQDLSTVPQKPIVITTVEPILKGTGEALSTVRLTVSFQGGTETVYTFIISADGTWEQQLNLIPRDIPVYLDFLITDRAGNMSALEDIPLIIYSQKIILIEIPRNPPEEPIQIALPVLSAAEVKEKMITSVIKYSPATVQQFIASTGIFKKTRLVQDDRIWEYLPLVAILLVLHPLLKTILLAAPYATNLSFNTLKNIWRAIGIIWDHSPQGIVVNSRNQLPIPFCKVYLSGKGKNKQPYQASLVTNKHGVFFRQDIPEGEYQYSVSDKGCIFPSLRKPPLHLTATTFYQGDMLTITPSEPEPLIVIPVDITDRFHSRNIIRQKILQLPLLNYSVAALSLILVVLSPSLINSLSFSCYCLLFLGKYLRRHLNRHSLTYVTQKRQPVPYSIVAAHDTDKHVDDIQQTDETGSVFISAHAAKSVEFVDFTYQVSEAAVDQIDQQMTIEVEPAIRPINFIR